jgi:anti-anti-sigma factor
MPDVTSQHLDVRDQDDVTVVTFRDARILDEITISELGQELFHLVDVENRKKLVLDFSRVEFLSSAALGKLITLRRKVHEANGYLKLCEIRPETLEVFLVAKLDSFFDIHPQQAAALASF